MTQTIRDPRAINADEFPFTGTTQEQLYFLLNYAVLAPSGHNAQPWLFRLNHSSLDIIFDRTRALAIVDPNNRELMISCGAAIGTFELAAKYFAYQTCVEFAPTGQDADLLATLSLVKGSPPSSEDTAVFKAIKTRQTNRSPFGDEKVYEEVLAQCVSVAARYAVEFTHCSDNNSKSAIAELVAIGDRLQFSQPWFRSELSSWMHANYIGSKDGMSASRFGIPDILTPVAGFIVRTFNIGKRVADSNKKKILTGSPVLAVFASGSDTQQDWLNTGRALAHVLLTLTCHGLSASYINQVIETATLRSQLHKLSTALAYPQIMLRIGRANSSPLSVRRCVDDCLIK